MYGTFQLQTVGQNIVRLNSCAERPKFLSETLILYFLKICLSTQKKRNV
jgi:hypothetical protein